MGGGFLFFDQRLHHTKVLGRRELDVGGLAFDHRHRMVGRGDQLRVVIADNTPLGGLTMSPRQQLVRKRLRRLSENDARAVQALDQAIALDALHSIPRCDGRERRARFHGRGQHPPHQRRCCQRTRGVVHEHEVAFTERRQPGTHRFLAALAAGFEDDGFPRVHRLHLALGVLEAARRADDDDPVHLIERQEQLQHPGQRGPAVELDERLAAAAEPRAGARGRHDGSYDHAGSSRLGRPFVRLPSPVPAGSAKIIRPAEVWITDVTVAVIVWFSRRRPFWITTMVPSSRLPTPWPCSLPSRATVTTISSPGIATGRIACASSLRFSTATPSRRAMRLRLKSLVMIAQPLAFAVRTRCASISLPGGVSSSFTWRLIEASFCISVRTSRPRRPRRRRVTSAESATICSSRSTELRITSGMSRKPVLAMSWMRPSMITEASSSTARTRCSSV